MYITTPTYSILYFNYLNEITVVVRKESRGHKVALNLVCLSFTAFRETRSSYLSYEGRHVGYVNWQIDYCTRLHGYQVVVLYMLFIFISIKRGVIDCQVNYCIGISLFAWFSICNILFIIQLLTFMKWWVTWYYQFVYKLFCEPILHVNFPGVQCGYQSGSVLDENGSNISIGFRRLFQWVDHHMLGTVYILGSGYDRRWYGLSLWWWNGYR